MGIDWRIVAAAGLVFSTRALSLDPLSLHETIPATLSLDVSMERIARVDEDEVTVRYFGRSARSGLRTLGTIQSAFYHFFLYLDQQGIEHDQRCLDLELNVYELTDEELNNRALMSFLSWDRWGNRGIHGVYDSVNSREGQGGIFFSGSMASAEEQAVLVAHEASHFLQELYCISGSLESMTRDFERFFRERNSSPDTSSSPADAPRAE
ncbi:MAG: hypothetical protein QGG40_14890 [Myxococcota bacterium]|jgi:hypothetical protein|nr:hypothetical protein [Myxococcota bacterium]